MIVYLLALTSTNHRMGVLGGRVVMVLLYPPLKRERPVGLAARRVEWSQWLVFCSAYALIVGSGLESSTPLKLAAGLFGAGAGVAPPPPPHSGFRPGGGVGGGRGGGGGCVSPVSRGALSPHHDGG